MLLGYELAAVALLIAGAAVAYSLQWRFQGLDKKPRVRDVVVSSVILFAATAGALAILDEGKAILQNLEGGTGGGNATEDSPVNPHGGSAMFRGQWDCPNASQCSMPMPSGSGKAVLFSLDGVDPIGSGPGENYNDPKLVSLKIKENWVVLFTFRTYDNKKDQNKTLKLCTTNQDCSLAEGKAGATLYLVGDGHGTFTRDDRDNPVTRYDYDDPGQCEDHSTKHETPCNHIFSVTVQTMKNQTGTEYHCVDGECSISIGVPDP